MSPMFGRVRSWFLTGLLVLAPSAVTLWVLYRLLNWVDNLLGRYLRFEALDYHRIPGFGLLATCLLLVIVGFVTTKVGEGPLARLWDRLLTRIPGVGIVYGSTKSLGEAFLTGNGFKQRPNGARPVAPQRLHDSKFETGQGR